MTKKIEIEWLHDNSDCDVCGVSWAQGAVVFIDGEEFLRLEPSAHCTSCDDWTEEEVYKAVLEKLGYEFV